MQLHLPGLRAFVRMRLGARLRVRETSMDLVQSVCGEVLEDLQQFEYQGPDSFRRWLFRCAENKLRKRDRFWRRERRELDREAPLEEGGLSRELRILATPSRDAVAQEELERLEEALQELPEDYREVILLSRVLGLSHEQVAKEMERSTAATRTLLFRALARLSTLLQQDR